MHDRVVRVLEDRSALHGNPVRLGNTESRFYRQPSPFLRRHGHIVCELNHAPRDRGRLSLFIEAILVGICVYD